MNRSSKQSKHVKRASATTAPPRPWWPVVLCAALLAATTAAMAFGLGFRKYKWLAQAGTAQYAVGFASIAVVFVLALLCGRLVQTRTPGWIERTAKSDPWPWMGLRYERRFILRATVLTMLFWIPALVLQFPTAMNGDTYNQLYQFQTSAPTYYSTLSIVFPESFIDHHPVFDTLLFGSFWWLGDALGSQNAGLFLYTVCQSALTAGVLCAWCCYLEHLGVTKPFRLLSWAFVTFVPFIPLWAASMEKDALFSALFALFLLYYMEAFRTRGQSLGKPRAAVGFAALALLCVLTKKTGQFVVLPSLIVLAVYCFRDNKRAVLRLAGTVVAVPVVCSLVLPAVVWPAIGGVAAGGRQESFGFALQQVTTVLVNDDDLTADERAAVEGVLDTELAVQRYDAGSVDPAKNSVHRDATRDDYLRFIRAYFSIGVRHIPEYTYSVATISAGLLCPGVPMKYNWTCEQEDSWVQKFQDNDATDELALTFYKPAGISAAAEFTSNAIAKICKVPPFRIIFSRGMFGGWIPTICIALALTGGKRSLVAYLPIILSVGFVLLSPVTSARYVVPLMYAAVPMMGMLCYFLCWDGQEERERCRA